jgi:hypothetical protein
MRFARRKPNPTRRSSTSWIRKTTRFAIYARDGFDCWFCNGLFPLAYDGYKLTLDHITPMSQGGDDSPGNLITACHDCNSRRQHLELPADVAANARKQASRPLNRELGRLYADLYIACRRSSLQHPLTLRHIATITYSDLQEPLCLETNA